MKEAANRADPDGRHGGDIAGIRKHLDYIAGMGFTQLWPTPLLENDQPAYSYHGYAITDLYRTDPRMGSNEDFVALSREAKAKGIGIVMDDCDGCTRSFRSWLFRDVRRATAGAPASRISDHAGGISASS